MRYRKKPVMIDAQLFKGSQADAEALVAWINESTGRPTAVALQLPRSVVETDLTWPWHIEILTLEGVMTAQPTDWIIKGVKGEFYPIRADVFRATYEADS